MRTTPSALERLLAPIAPAQFLQSYWEKAVRLGRPGGDVCDHVLTEGDLDELLARNDLRYPTISLVKDGRNVPISQYSSVLRYGPYASEGLIDSDCVFRELNGGATVVCQLLQNSVQRTAQFVAALAEELGFRVDAHAFITPQNSSGLSTHYDTTSAFILQISGKKTWRLYEPLVELPTVDQVFDESAGAVFTQTDEIVLERGDFLYLPRGIPHCPYTFDSHSVHVTLVLFAPSWIDLLQQALTACTSENVFRRAPRADEDYSPEVRNELFQKLEAAALATLGTRATRAEP
jgi:ribosomal protein L16 Arg81 hydroxylase